MTILNEIRNKMTETAKSAIKKSNEIVEVTKLSISIGDAQSRIDKLLKDIGKIMYDAYKSGEIFSEEISTICLEIDEIADEINSMRQKIAQLKNVKVCPVCEKENESDASFCSRCGHKISEEAAGEE
ncbi:MAG: hypothetical protein PWR27_279 [Petroclostridium sp.]|jgi:methyl-accepting chemotaxis protein|uniref:zinc ribbon domain-containing protein n=1 Tax=Petroclostridium xylanilyticum TaxID=1792311 RepID=UPI000B99B17E|nr:zinc ribbon domain-containing protein [Petroclostridium xylanilyticum]MBZ4644849.1 zinc-ribbon protein [Clostridia bacterium]MDK2809570.1 hypothetical protein [Petroclostridium sp.]